MSTTLSDTASFAEVNNMLAFRKPWFQCENCVDNGHMCSFEAWARNCKECDFSMRPGCSFLSYNLWLQFSEEDDQRAVRDLGASNPSPGVETRLERYTRLYPQVERFFHAAEFLGHSRTVEAINNLIESLPIESLLRLRASMLNIPLFESLCQVFTARIEVLEVREAEAQVPFLLRKSP